MLLRSCKGPCPGAVGLSVLASLCVSAAAHADLVAFYPFDSGPWDAGGNGLHATVFGASLRPEYGFEGGSYSFDGSSAWLEAPVNINPGEMPVVTIGAWARNSWVNSTAAIMTNADGPEDRWLGLAGPDDELEWSAQDGSEGYTPGIPVTPEWTFLAVVYDQNAQLVRLHVNDTVIITPGELDEGRSTLRIGASYFEAQLFEGSVDNVFIFDEALSIDRLADIYKRGSEAIPAPSGLLALALFAAVNRRRR